MKTYYIDLGKNSNENEEACFLDLSDSDNSKCQTTRINNQQDYGIKKNPSLLQAGRKPCAGGNEIQNFEIAMDVKKNLFTRNNEKLNENCSTKSLVGQNISIQKGEYSRNQENNFKELNAQPNYIKDKNNLEIMKDQYHRKILNRIQNSLEKLVNSNQSKLKIKKVI